MAIYLITFLSFLLMILIFLYTPKQETLGNAFNGGVSHTTQAEKFIKRTISLISLLICIVLILIKFYPF